MDDKKSVCPGAGTPEQTESKKSAAPKMYHKITRVSTAGMTDAEWEEMRRSAKTIGGSDAGTILGLNQYKSRYALWAEKIGLVDPPDLSGNEAVREGKDLEDYVAKRFSEETGKSVRRARCTFVNSEYPFAHANVDRMIDGEDAGLECKTSSSFSVIDDCESGTPPKNYVAQCVHYMAVTGKSEWYLAILCFGRGFYVFKIERDEEEIEALMEIERGFYDLVQSGTAPEVDGSDSTSAAIKDVFADSYDCDVDLSPVSAAIRTYADLKSKIKALQTALDEAQNTVEEYMGNAERGATDGFRVSWKSQTRRTFDAKRFAEDHPDVKLDSYYKSSTARPFKIKEVK